MMENVIIAETDRIGDVILSLPVFKSIKMFDKRIKITALVNTYTEELFKHIPYVDDVISFTTLDKNDINNLSIIIKNRNFDTAIILHPNYTVSKILKKAQIKNRYSYGWKWYQFLFTKFLVQHRSRNIKHQLEYNLDLLQLADIPIANKLIKLKPDKGDINFVDKLLKEKKLHDKFLITIHPGSGKSAVNLPPYKYVELIQLLQKKFKKAKIILTGSQKDKKTINYILTEVKSSLYPMPLNLNLSNLTALISKTNVFISNSTGPMHIASALRIPVIAFFSPVFVHGPERWGPFWGQRLIIKPAVDCMQKWKCKGKPCHDYNCFDNINFNEVIKFIQEIIMKL